MELKAETVENKEEVEESQFQQDLSKWFQNQGIIADLRSHLRYLMISALQRKQSGTKPIQKTSLKTHALNLLIAEYLFRLECHYTLSIFTSEVPVLSGFSCMPSFCKSSFQKNSSIISFFEKQHPTNKNKFKKIFKENEVQEIFNALGLSLNSEELDFLKTIYFKSCNDISLLEIFFSSYINMSSKINIPKYIEKSNKAIGKDKLSVQWGLEVKHLLNEQIKEPELSAFYNSLVSITENELKRILEKDHLQHIEALRDRENRIREQLIKYEKDIIIRLSNAKNDLILQKDSIDKKLIEKQKVLFKMVLEWKSKHEEIMELSKQFYKKRDENKILQETLGEMEKKINYYELQEIKQNEIINNLQSQNKSLVNKLEAITECKNTLSNLFEEFINKENVSRLTVPEKEQKRTEKCLPPFETCSSQSENSPSPISVKDEAVNAPFCKSSSEEIVLRARNRLEVLAKESLKINKNYWECKNKYCDNTDSETSQNLSGDSAQKNVSSAEKIVHKENASVTFLHTKLKTNKKRKKSGVVYNFSPEEMKGENNGTKDFKNLLVSYSNTKNSIARDLKEKGSIVKVPSQRQLKNRECFFKNKQLLQELENQQRSVEELIATTTTSFSTSGSSSDTFNEQVNANVNTTKIQNPIREPFSSTEINNISNCYKDKISKAKCKSL